MNIFSGRSTRAEFNVFLRYFWVRSPFGFLMVRFALLCEKAFSQAGDASLRVFEALLRCPKVVGSEIDSSLQSGYLEKRSQALLGSNLTRNIQASDAPKVHLAPGSSHCQGFLSTRSLDIGAMPQKTQRQSRPNIGHLWPKGGSTTPLHPQILQTSQTF